jgi:glycosyltransferase involved in cell wall biosynthesis
LKVILECQHAVGHPQPRGIGHYSINLIQALLKRKVNDYELTFFDYKKEMGNAERAEKFFGSFGVPISECNDLDYRIASRNEELYSNKSYNAWTNTKGDIYHFMHKVAIPTNIDGKVIVTVHDVMCKSHPEICAPGTAALLDEGIRRLEKIKPIVIADSQSSKQELLTYTTLDEKNIHVIYLSYDEANLYPDRTSVSDIVDGDYIFYVGALAPNKNIPRIINAFSIVAEKHKSLKLVIAGEVGKFDDKNSIEDALSSCPCRDRIIFPGYVTTEQKRRLYSNALCFLFPSICEGFGLPVLEAMACGCPVITSDNTSIPEVGGDAVLYVNAFDTEQLAFETQRVASSESLRKELETSGLAQAKTFSWDKTAKMCEEVYKIAGDLSV